MRIAMTDPSGRAGCAVIDFVTEIEARVGAPVDVLGAVHLDGDGREVPEPCAHGVTIVGFCVRTV
jgi:hypothetical protein